MRISRAIIVGLWIQEVRASYCYTATKLAIPNEEYTVESTIVNARVVERQVTLAPLTLLELVTKTVSAFSINTPSIHYISRQAQVTDLYIHPVYVSSCNYNPECLTNQPIRINHLQSKKHPRPHALVSEPSQSMIGAST